VQGALTTDTRCKPWANKKKTAGQSQCRLRYSAKVLAVCVKMLFVETGRVLFAQRVCQPRLNSGRVLRILITSRFSICKPANIIGGQKRFEVNVMSNIYFADCRLYTRCSDVLVISRRHVGGIQV